MTAILDLSEKVMGKVHTTLTIVNPTNQVLVENGDYILTQEELQLTAIIDFYGKEYFLSLPSPNPEFL